MLALQQYNKAVAIVPSNTVNFDGTTYDATNRARPCDAIYVGGAGTVTVVFADGSTAQFTAVAGGYLFVKAIRVNSTGTGGSLLVALYQV